MALLLAQGDCAADHRPSDAPSAIAVMRFEKPLRPAAMAASVSAASQTMQAISHFRWASPDVDRYNAAELYVALSRGCRAVTVLSSSPVLTPAAVGSP